MLRYLLLLAIMGLASPVARAQGGLLADGDADGLDDVLELRLGSDPAQADTDGDGLTDLEEFLGGSDPRVTDATPPRRLATPRATVQAYAVGSQVVVVGFLEYTTSLSGVLLSWSDGVVRRDFGLADLTSQVVATAVHPLPSASPYQVRTFHLVLPKAFLTAAGSSAFVLEADLDGPMRYAGGLAVSQEGAVLAELRPVPPSGPPVLQEAERDFTLVALDPEEAQDEPLPDFICVVSYRSWGIYSDGYAIVNNASASCLPLTLGTCFINACSGMNGGSRIVPDWKRRVSG